jgi:hypothetical protein
LEQAGWSSLLTDEAASLIATAIGPLRLLGMRPVQINLRLGDSLTVAYEVDLHGTDGTPEQRLVMARSGGSFPEGVTVLTDGASSVGTWIYPFDPYLPGLSSLHDRDALASLLDQLGVAGPGRINPRSYRPGRRAVVEVIAPKAHLFIKAVRPHAVAELQARHRLVAETLPVPRSLGWSAENGLVVLEAIEGTLLAEALAHRPPPNLPQAAGLAALLDRLPQFDQASIGSLRRAREHIRLLELITPESAGGLADLVAGFPEYLEPPRPVHGDLHTGQIVLRPGEGLGLLDLDRAGMGQRSDDFAGLLAHLKPGEYRDRLFAGFEQMVDPRDLRLRTAAALLGFATTPFSTQRADWPAATRRMIALARSWAG